MTSGSGRPLLLAMVVLRAEEVLECARRRGKYAARRPPVAAPEWWRRGDRVQTCMSRENIMARGLVSRGATRFRHNLNLTPTTSPFYSFSIVSSLSQYGLF